MSPSIDLFNDASVAGALTQWCAERFATTVRLTECTRVAGGMDNHVYLVRLDGSLPSPWSDPLVVRIRPDAGRIIDAERETAVVEWLHAAGYPVPAILAAPTTEPFGAPAQIMTRASGTSMIEAITSRPWQARATVRRLAALHARLHRLPTTAWPGTTRTLADQRMRRVRDEVALHADPELTTALARVERLDVTGRFSPSTPAPCHGDFHPLNVVSGPAHDTVIDWTDATLDEPIGDIARTTALFGVSAVAGRNGLERALLRAIGPLLARVYSRAYRDGVNPTDPDAFARAHRAWECVHLINGWAQIAGIRSGSITTTGTEVPDSITQLVRRQLDERLDTLDV